jgi:hypothetical protein
MGHDVGLADVLLAITLYMVTGFWYRGRFPPPYHAASP